ncbi:MAG: OsmC family protein [Candidatus Cloacimonetes bacterium]|nr:OsmC family protein [Candidatus Cloacimonadota bacterium]MCF7814498.1 OsmC family protein [Candidatus Cloacimonadota bacterium]MCF7869067.1 OsmC family protein [Candidatus Cloacimonadota bacterium]MCF7884462.1 OsmC family protein [Candidatus Cloacimonadota bacterium]
MSITKLKWLGDMAFDAELNNHHFTIDADLSVGGKDQGPRPKGLLLSGLAGCTGMDVVSILKKMKVTNYKLELDVDADSTSEHPKIYSKIYLSYKFEGNDLPIDKIKRAVELSETRYCGVSAMLRKSAEIETKILINGEEI